MPFHPFTHYIFRSPLFPFDYLKRGEKSINSHAFAEALLVASPDLSQGMDKGADRAQYSSYRYYQRACTRPTPFGLFAGCSVGSVGDYTEIKLSEQEKYKRVTRLDMNYICALTQQIEREREVREQLRYYPNSSIYIVGNHLRYVEYHYRKTHRIHRISQGENSEYLQKVLTLAKQGTRFTALAGVLVDNEIVIEEATAFVHELIDSQVLISELEPAVTHVQPFAALIAKLSGLPRANREVVSILSEIEAHLNNIDQQPIGDAGDIYPQIIENIGKTKVEAEIKYLFQTDMFKPVQQATVSRNIIRDIQQTLLFLNKITPQPERTNLSQFKESFAKRYEECEMPLESGEELNGTADIITEDISLFARFFNPIKHVLKSRT